MAFYNAFRPAASTSGVPAEARRLMAMQETSNPSGWRPPAPVPLDAPLGLLASVWALRDNPITTWTKAHFELPIVIGPSVLGTVAVLNDPAAIRRVFVDNTANYRKDDLQKRIIGPALLDGLVEAEADQWKKQRRMLAPLFTPRTVASFAPAMQAAAERLVARWLRHRDGRLIDAQKEMSEVALDVLGRTLFSDGLGRGPEEFTAAISRNFETAWRVDPFDLLDLPAWLPRIGKLRARPSQKFMAKAVADLISRRKRLISEGNAPQDLLTLLLEARDPETGEGLGAEEVTANIVTFIGAGHETTANALAWSLFLLSNSPEWDARLAAEAARVLALPVEVQAENLVETRAVIEEAMRLYPPVASMSRQAQGPDDLCGRRIRKDTLVIVSPWVLHRHRMLWSEPDSFDPARFLPGAREKIDRFAYLPFGVGPRICIGAAFALQEAAIVLANIVHRFRLELKPGHAVRPVQHLTLRPEGGLPMIARHRPDGVNARSAAELQLSGYAASTT
jgi:cytochrome P450